MLAPLEHLHIYLGRIEKQLEHYGTISLTIYPVVLFYHREIFIVRERRMTI